MILVRKELESTYIVELKDSRKEKSTIVLKDDIEIVFKQLTEKGTPIYKQMYIDKRTNTIYDAIVEDNPSKEYMFLINTEVTYEHNEY